MATDPVADLTRAMRLSLETAGLARKEDGGSVYFAGGGRPGAPLLLLLHGTNDQAGTWARVVPMLTRKYRLIVPDLAGHGDSRPLSGPIPIPLVIERLHQIVEREEARDLTIAGNSFGAWIAILYTLAHPDRVQQLVLESGGGLSRPLAVPLVARDRKTAMTILRAVHGPNYVPQEWVIDALLARANDSPALRLTEAMENLVDARLPEIKVPATLVWGANDGVLPLPYAEALRDGIAGAQLHVIEDAAHIPHLQQPEKFVQCLTATS
ncbi:MAG TPA: alpha/beta fold hydrolase [Thermoanaerobaculia bacterium]|nr:alpha/beta fold hydrolase [Thermoanaerobaculia bacterium]